MPNVILKKFLEVEYRGVEYKVRIPKSYKDFKRISRNFFALVNVANSDEPDAVKQEQIDAITDEQYKLLAPLCYDFSNVVDDEGNQITSIQGIADIDETLAHGLAANAGAELVREANDIKKN